MTVTVRSSTSGRMNQPMEYSRGHPSAEKELFFATSGGECRREDIEIEKDQGKFGDRDERQRADRNERQLKRHENYKGRSRMDVGTGQQWWDVEEREKDRER